MHRLFAQGDLLIEEIGDQVPTGTLIPAARSGETVVAEGEATGHRHAFLERVAFFRDDLLARDIPAELYVGHVKVTDGTAYLRHDEHAAIALPPGTYRVRRQRQAEPNSVQIVTD